MATHDERSNPDERTLEFLRDMMTGDEPVPADVQARIVVEGGRFAGAGRR